jgi:hypothetical protein
VHWRDASAINPRTAILHLKPCLLTHCNHAPRVRIWRRLLVPECLQLPSDALGCKKQLHVHGMTSAPHYCPCTKTKYDGQLWKSNSKYVRLTPIGLLNKGKILHGKFNRFNHTFSRHVHMQILAHKLETNSPLISVIEWADNIFVLLTWEDCKQCSFSG